MVDVKQAEKAKELLRDLASPAVPANGEKPDAGAVPGQRALQKCPKCGASVSPEFTECASCRTLLFPDPAPSPQDRLQRIRGYSLAQLLFREREYLFEAVFREAELGHKLSYYAAHAFLCAAIYGLLLGGYGGWLSMPVSAAKIPLLLFGTLVICAPALATFNVILGSKLTLQQTLTVLVTATYLMAAVLASLAPILFFFILSGSSYEFVVLLNVVACAIAGGIGVRLLWEGLRYLTIKTGQEPRLGILKLWMVIYMFVGTQLAWTLRPFVGAGNDFVLFRPLEGDFYTALLKLAVRLLS